MKNLSFQMRLVAAFMLVIVIVLGSVLLSASAFIRDRMITTKQQELIRKGTDIAERIRIARETKGSATSLTDILSGVDSYLEARVWVLDASQQPVEMSTARHTGTARQPGMGAGRMSGMMRNIPGNALPQMGNFHSLLADLDPVYRGEVVSKIIDHPYYEERMVLVGVPILSPNGNVEGAVLINSPVAAVNDFMVHIYEFIGIGALIGILLSFLVVRLFTRSLVRPLRAMQSTAAAIAEGDYSARVDVRSNDEIGSLGSTINGLAQDLGDYMLEVGKTEKLRRDFIANVSHELRTPLTVIRGYIEAMADGVVKEPGQIKRYQYLIRDESIRLERLIKDLLNLSRLQSASADSPLTPVSLSEIATHVMQLISPLAESKTVMLHSDTALNLPLIHGNQDRLIQLLLIFLDNAVKYTPPGGSVTLSLKQKEIGALNCVIQDTGIGIPVEDLPYIWERFYKVDKSHQQSDEGTGLGLAIARQIISLHEAQAYITSEINVGTLIELEFHTATADSFIIAN
jgi:signal transduction histidine kinase